MLYALLLRSANSAAVVLAEACSGSVEAFAEEMNKKAAELGMDDTHFVNPNGLDTNGHQSTAADMAVLARYAMQNAKFRDDRGHQGVHAAAAGPLVARVREHQPASRQVRLGDRHQDRSHPEGRAVLRGLRHERRRQRHQRRAGPARRPKLCFSESKALLEYGFTQCRALTLLDKGDVVAEAEVPYQVDGRLQLVTAGEVRTELYKDDSVTMSVQLDRELDAAGDGGRRLRQGESDTEGRDGADGRLGGRRLVRPARPLDRK